MGCWQDLGSRCDSVVEALPNVHKARVQTPAHLRRTLANLKAKTSLLLKLRESESLVDYISQVLTKPWSAAIGLVLSPEGILCLLRSIKPPPILVILLF